MDDDVKVIRVDFFVPQGIERYFRELYVARQELVRPKLKKTTVFFSKRNSIANKLFLILREDHFVFVGI